MTQSPDANDVSEVLSELRCTLADRTEERDGLLRQRAATADVSKAMVHPEFQLQVVLQQLLEAALKLCNAQQGLVISRDGAVYRVAAQAGLSSEFEEFLTHAPISLEGVFGVGRSERADEVLHISDDPGYRTSVAYRLGGFRCLLLVPLILNEEIVGAFCLGRAEPARFADHHIDLLVTFAVQASAAMEHGRLLAEMKEAIAGQIATAEILGVIAASPADIQPVFDAIAERARLLCRARVGATTRFDGELLHLVGYHGASPEAEASMRSAFPMSPGRGSVNARAIQAKTPVQIADVHLDPEYQVTDPAEQSGFSSGLGVPLLLDGRAIGSIFVGRTEPGIFSVRLINLLQTFADQAVIAIENVRLFNEVRVRTAELAASLDDLRAAQNRLVQTEKLASLGQLAAGIAHEIKNPLNFINNFAALSAELVDELGDALAEQDLGADIRAVSDEIAVTLKGNLQKVVQHGRRADSIVRNMLLHSREGSGAHCATDINALVDESLNLAYHGARAENVDFNIALRRDLDPSVGLADVFPQELTRVLLNLISNGFYATAKRGAEQGDGFEPLLTASTRDLGDKIQIRIRDNGTGIPEATKDKIFNPFFTTKPAGEGTGLGLSMSHDIVVKQHGGEINVESEPGAFTEFIVTFPRKATTYRYGG